jgi:hypothetical protein
MIIVGLGMNTLHANMFSEENTLHELKDTLIVHMCTSIRKKPKTMGIFGCNPQPGSCSQAAITAPGL